jgi:hypothetical protein
MKAYGGVDNFSVRSEYEWELETCVQGLVPLFNRRNGIHYSIHIAFDVLRTGHISTFEIHEYDPELCVNHTVSAFIGTVHALNDQTLWSSVTFLLRIWKVAGSNLNPHVRSS